MSEDDGQIGTSKDSDQEDDPNDGFSFFMQNNRTGRKYTPTEFQNMRKPQKLWRRSFTLPTRQPESLGRSTRPKLLWWIQGRTNQTPSGSQSVEGWTVLMLQASTRASKLSKIQDSHSTSPSSNSQKRQNLFSLSTRRSLHERLQDGRRQEMQN